MVWLFWLGLVVVPFGACLAFPNAFRYVVALGAVAAAIEWAIAYRSSQVEHGGDWQPGSALLVSTGFLALLLWALWLSLALIGTALGRRRKRR